MKTKKVLNGKPYAGNPHVRFDEGEVASAAMPRRGSLFYATRKPYEKQHAGNPLAVVKLATIAVAAVLFGSYADEIVPSLPDGYAPLDWIESTGGQYIDTGVDAGANTTIDMSFGHCVYYTNIKNKQGVSTHESTLFGKDKWGPRGWLFVMQEDHFRFFGNEGTTGTAWNLIGIDSTWQRDYRFTLGADNTARMFDANGTELCALATDRSATTHHPLWLFKCNDPQGKPAGKFRLYSAKIGTDEGETLRDFVPARRMGDRAVGLYDRVTKRFFANAGTGAFIASDDRYVFLDWIESTGTQYINTGVDAGANTTIDMTFGHCVYVNNSESTLFGKDVWGPQGWLFVMQANYFRFFGAKNGWNLIGIDSTVQCDYRFTLGADDKARMFDADGTELCALATDRSATTHHPLWLFDSNDPLGKPAGKFRLYSAKIGTDAGETLRDFVPARRASDNAIGLYDRETECFFANAGTGAFLAPTSGDPVTAIWTGAGDGTNILQEANWRCYNADGQTMADALPGPNTVVRMTDVAMASVSAGTVWPYGKVVIGAQDHPLTEWGRISYGANRYPNADMPNYNFVNLPLADYVWKGAQSGIDAQLDGVNTAWMDSNLKQSQLRFDGWVYVDDTKSGTWSILQCFDDYFYFTLDGQMLAQNLTYLYATNFTAQVSSGWHRFSIICGDCWGGYGSLRWEEDGSWTGVGLSYGPMTITAGESTFKFSELPGGSGENRITLAYDCDWRGLGIIDLGNAQKIDLAGHRLYVAGFTGDGRLGPEITDSVGGGELHLDNASDWANSTVRISGGLKLFKEGRGTFTSSFHDQTYSGGTEVVAGTFKCGGLESFGSREGTVTVRAGATLDLDGWGNAGGRKYVLDGGTIKSEVMRAYRNTTWLDDVTLTADSFMAGRDFGFHQVNGETHLDLGGNTLSINSTAAGREFVFCSLSATGGGRIVVNGVGNLGYFNVSFSPDIVLEQGVRMVCYSHLNSTYRDLLGGYDASGYTLDDSCETNMCAQIAGRFKPGANFHVCKLLDGATLDLSAFSEPWSCTGLTEGVTCGFADDAVIKVDVGERKLKNGECVLRWADGARPYGTRFEFVSSVKHRRLACAADGLYYNCGFIVIVR